MKSWGVSAGLLEGHLERRPEQNEATDDQLVVAPVSNMAARTMLALWGTSGSRPGPSRGSFVSLGRESTDSQRGNPFGAGSECSGFRGAPGALGIRLGCRKV